MVVQRLAPWASLLASLLTLVYVTVQEWRQREHTGNSERETNGDSDSSIAQVVSRLDVLIYTTLAMLLIAAVLHYLLLFTPFTVLIVPVWLLTVFVILATGATQAMPGEEFGDKLERVDRELQASSEATAESPDPEEKRSENSMSVNESPVQKRNTDG